MVSMIRRFPVQVSLTALFVYALTLSHGVTLASLPLTAKLAGWDWQPMNTQPLLWLLTLPLRLLPSGWVAPALNFFSALCGAFTLGILARSLELVSWDRPLQILSGWRAKLPIVFACLVCGLEFNFWQEATAANGEMLQILLFATAILCLLEFRVRRNERWIQGLPLADFEMRWLRAAAFVWGLGLAENWMMIITLPLFLLALLWLGKLELLKKELLMRLLLAILAGFAITFLLPLANSLSPDSPWSFGEAWLNWAKNFKHLLGNLYGQFWRGHRLALIAVVVFFLVPILPGIVRLNDEGTQNKSPLDQIQVWLYRVLRAALLLAVVWLVFDPVVGPRQLVLKQTGLSMSFLSFDYLLSLGGGFLAGNLLLALGAQRRDNYRPPNFLEIYSQRAAIPAFTLLMVIVTVGLLLRNAPAITLTNRQPLSQFGKIALHNLPSSGGIILSDDPLRLMVFKAAAGDQNRQWLGLDTLALPSSAYRRQLARHQPGDWLTNTDKDNLTPAGMFRVVKNLSETKKIYYLHPSFGYFFDYFYLQPCGPIFEFQSFTNKSVNPPPLTAATLTQTEKFWDDLAPSLNAIEQTCFSKKTGLDLTLQNIYERLHWQAVPTTQSQLLGQWYSVALNDWGVRLQQAGQLTAAQKRFEQALALNPDNPVAKINLQCNTNLAAGAKLNLAAVDTLAGQLGSLQRMNRLITAFGAADEPSFCYLRGNVYLQAGLPRQALQQYERARALAPTVLAPQIALAELYARCGFNEQSRQIISHVRSEQSTLLVKNNLDVSLALMEANSWLSQTNPANARSVLQSVLKEHPGDERATSLVLRAYLAFGDYTNALQLANRQLAANPESLGGLLNLAGIYMQLGEFSNSLPILDHALTLSNLPPTRLARAIARVETARYAEAGADYLELQKTATNNLPIYFGLAEIASRQHDTNRAADYLQRCLAELPANSPQRENILTRLNALKKP
jgi:tetratricopeptide (TPR) repeat protein